MTTPICRICGEPFERGDTPERQHSCESCIANSLSGPESQHNVEVRDPAT